MKNAFMGLGTGILCISQWVNSEQLLSVTISALTEQDWVVLQGNHAIMVETNPNSQKRTWFRLRMPLQGWEQTLCV